MFKSINEERKTFSRKVVDDVRELIVSGKLKAGDKLPAERELAEMMNVSRPTIREAFKILSAMGVLHIRHGQGVFVAERTGPIDSLASVLFLQTDTIHELFEVRRMIETETAAWAARRGTEAFLEQITAATRQVYSRVVEHNEFPDPVGREAFLSDSDQEFHLMIAEAAGNEVVLRIMNNLIDLFRESRMQSLKIPGRSEQSLQEHMEIADAIAARKPELARKSMLKHLKSVEADLLQPYGHPTGSTKAAKSKKQSTQES
jgi:GntR family transcriptional repressor for pyruvate dehydrogenase complex